MSGGVERGAASGSRRGSKLGQFVKSNSTRATAEWTDFTRRRRPPRLQPFDDSVLAVIHQYTMSKFRVPGQLSDDDRSAPSIRVVMRVAASRAICAVLRGLGCFLSAFRTLRDLCLLRDWLPARLVLVAL